jgi:hypothetical protein
VQATGPTNDHPRMAALAGPGVKHAPDELRGCVELDRQRPLVLSPGHLPGLGLSTGQGIVGDHGARIELESTPGRGVGTQGAQIHANTVAASVPWPQRRSGAEEHIRPQLILPPRVGLEYDNRRK